MLTQPVFDELRAGHDLYLEDEKGRDLIRAAFVQDIFQYDIAACLKRWPGGPVLLLHGLADPVVSWDQARANYDCLRGPKQLVLIEGGDHSFAHKGEEAGRTPCPRDKVLIICRFPFIMIIMGIQQIFQEEFHP